jgi:hypothetical protein
MTTRIQLLLLGFSLAVVEGGAQENGTAANADFHFLLRKMDVAFFAGFPTNCALSGTLDLDFLKHRQKNPTLGVRLAAEHVIRPVLSGEGAGNLQRSLHFVALLRVTGQGSSTGFDIYGGYFSPDLVNDVWPGNSIKAGFDMRFALLKPVAALFLRFSALFYKRDSPSRLTSYPDIGIGVSFGYQRYGE